MLQMNRDPLRIRGTVMCPNRFKIDDFETVRSAYLIESKSGTILDLDVIHRTLALSREISKTDAPCNFAVNTRTIIAIAW